MKKRTGAGKGLREGLQDEGREAGPQRTGLLPQGHWMDEHLVAW